MTAFFQTYLGPGFGWAVTYDPASVVLSVTGAVAVGGYELWASAITNSQTNYTDSATGDGYPNLLKYATGSSPTTPDQLARIGELLPAEWLAAAATGSPEQCAAAVQAQLDLGVDGVILHGSPPEDLAPVLPAYRRIRRSPG